MLVLAPFFRDKRGAPIIMTLGCPQPLVCGVRTVSIASLGVREFSEIAEECEDAVALVLCFKKIKHFRKR